MIRLKLVRGLSVEIIVNDVEEDRGLHHTIVIASRNEPPFSSGLAFGYDD